MISNSCTSEMCWSMLLLTSVKIISQIFRYIYSMFCTCLWLCLSMDKMRKSLSSFYFVSSEIFSKYMPIIKCTKYTKHNIDIFIKAVVFQNIGISWFIRYPTQVIYDFDKECQHRINNGPWYYTIICQILFSYTFE